MSLMVDASHRPVVLLASWVCQHCAAPAAAQLHWAVTVPRSASDGWPQSAVSCEWTVAALNPSKAWLGGEEVRTSVKQWCSLMLSMTSTVLRGGYLAFRKLWKNHVEQDLSHCQCLSYAPQTQGKKHWGKVSRKSRMSAACTGIMLRSNIEVCCGFSLTQHAKHILSAVWTHRQQGVRGKQREKKTTCEPQKR